MSDRNTRIDQREALLADHRWIEHQLARLLSAFEADDAAVIGAVWDPLERFLLVHLDSEEALVYPRLAECTQNVIPSLLREHAEIRAGAALLGLSLEIHSARVNVATRFADLVRTHAEREDLLLLGAPPYPNDACCQIAEPAVR